MKTIGFIACVASKEKGGPYKAKDLYKSAYFKYNYEWMTNVAKPDKLYIVTAHKRPMYDKEEIRALNGDFSSIDFREAKVFIDPEEEIYEYDSYNFSTFPKNFFRALLRSRTEDFINETGINPQEVKIISTLDQHYTSVIRDYFPNWESPFEGLQIGKRLHKLKKEVEEVRLS